MADAFQLSGLLGILMGIYCFTLPHTPPSREKQSERQRSRRCARSSATRC